MKGTPVKIVGLDIGSRTVGAVWLEHGTSNGNRSEPRIVRTALLDSGSDPQAEAARLLTSGDHDLVVATGYGRRAAAEHLGAQTITEIKAYALGARRLCPQARAILDIGGQDTKVIAVSALGAVEDFEMNDRCAAGTGRFLEVMAQALELGIDEFGDIALQADGAAQVSSMCTVFAESEVVGLLHRGVPREQIALGLHQAVARRTLAMLKRVDAAGPLLFAGGVARNPAMRRLVADGHQGPLLTVTEPQLVGAVGAALHGLETKR